MYLEGESDERILRAWAGACAAQAAIDKVHLKSVRGGGKESMKQRADQHFVALFENPDALFHQLRNADPPLQPIREDIALSMSAEETHDDVHQFIGKLQRMTGVA